MSDVQHNPKALEAFIKNGIHVLEVAKDCPKNCFKGCSGILLIRAEEGGLGFSGQGGRGVLVGHKDGVWSNPVGVNFGGMGAGLVIGVVEKDVVIFLNPFAMKSLIEGKGHIKLGADFGIAIGTAGGAAAGEIEVSSKGGWATSYAFSYSKGAMINIEVAASFVAADERANRYFYSSADPADIIEGKVSPPEGSMAPELLDMLAKEAA